MEELSKRMSYSEYIGWISYFEVLAIDAEKAEQEG